MPNQRWGWTGYAIPTMLSIEKHADARHANARHGDARRADFTVLGPAGGQALHVVYIPPMCATPKSKIWDEAFSLPVVIPPNKILFLVHNFNAHLLGVEGFPAMHCPCYNESRHQRSHSSCSHRRQMWSVLAMRDLHILNGCKKLLAHMCHMTTAHMDISKTTVDYLVVNDMALGTITTAEIVDRPVWSTNKNYRSNLLLL